MLILNFVTAMFAILSAFCWYRSVVSSNDRRTVWQKLSAPLDEQLEKIAPSVWNYWAAVWTALAALCQGGAALISGFNA